MTNPSVRIDRSDWSRDTYQGQVEDLIAVGVLQPHQLTPQKGRTPGKTAFLPNGEPCPTSCRAWREPGYKAVSAREDGSYVVEITVSREEQKARRALLRATQREEAERRLNQELAEKGRSLIPERVKHEFHDAFESWEGTKAQLQSAGIGAGLAFPGEIGAPRTVHCSCPLGFGVEIEAHYDKTKAAAGLFRATSLYCKARWEWATEVTSFAPGVIQELRPIDRDRTRYVGVPNALVAAGLVPRADLFPGQPGRNKQQCAYRTDLTTATTQNGQGWAFTIRRRGKERFEVEVPLPEAMAQKRKSDYKKRCEEHDLQLTAAREERKQLRYAVSGGVGANGVEGFRKEAERYVEWGLRMVEMALTDDKTLYTFDDSVLDELSGAFAAIRGAVHTAVVVKNSAVAKRLRQQKEVLAAKKDLGLQAFLRQVQSRPVDG